METDPDIKLCSEEEMKYIKIKSDIIDSGASGVIFKADLIDDIDKREVLVKIFKPTSDKHYKNEVDCGKVAGENGIGPKIYYSWECPSGKNNRGLIAMDIVGTKTLKKLFDEVNDPLFRDITSEKSIVTTLNIIRAVYLTLRKTLKLNTKYNISHSDLHANNVRVDFEKHGDYEICSNVWLIDYGLSMFHKDLIEKILDKIKETKKDKSKDKKDKTESITLDIIG